MLSIDNSKSSKLLRIGELLYLSLAVLSFYLLVESRTVAAHTVWQVLQPLFIPTLFVATFILLTISLTSEKVACKLMLIIIYSILIHSFFSMIFPAGDSSGQQLVLGETRRVFDNTILHGLSGWPNATIQIFVLEAFKGLNLQAALTTILARMLSIDIFYVHLFFIPTLWGVFVTIASFLIAKAIRENERMATLASLIVAAFPYTVYFGAISVPESLGFIFFLLSVYFMLRYLSGDDSKTKYLMVAFSFYSFFSHYLTGIMSISLLLLTVIFKTYEKEKNSSGANARILLGISFLVSVILLPLSFIYLRYFGTSSNPAFTLNNLYQLPFNEIIGLFFIGDLANSSDFKIVFFNVIGPLIGFLCMIYFVYRLGRDPNAKYRTQIHFVIATFIIIVIDYGVTKVFMEGLPLSPERLWVLRDFIAAPFVALAVVALVSSLQSFLRGKFPEQSLTGPSVSSKRNVRRILTLILTTNIMIPALVGGWITFSLSAAYPQVAPLQTTSYELEAVKYIEANEHEKYVVIGDVWTTYAGEMIVGINNPAAYYFDEYNKTGHDLFANMTQDPSAQWMLLAMNYTNTSAAYFIVTEPRLGSIEFNETVSTAEHLLPVFHVTGDGKLYIFSYRKG